MTQNISILNLTKSYQTKHGSVTALDNINLEIKAGKITAIIGPSGSGKSTLLQIIGSMEKPDNGEIFINGKDIVKFDSRQIQNFRATQIGFVFQQFYLQPYLTVEQNIKVPLIVTNINSDIQKQRVSDIIDLVNLSDKAKMLPNQLSGGQIQRVAIARSMVNNPNILLMDEPTGNLDLANASAILSLIRSINQMLGTTVIIVTHDLDIANLCDYKIEISNGKIII